MNRNVSGILGKQFGIWKERLLSRKNQNTMEDDDIEKFGKSCMTSLVEDDPWEK